jgi:anti-anti-sigma factor
MMENMGKHVVEMANLNGTILWFEQADLCAILLGGSMDTHVVAALRERVSAITDRKRCNYVVDLDGVSYISSTGLGFLMSLLKQQREFVYLSNPRPAVLKPFNLFDIKNLFRYYQSIDDLEKQPGLPGDVCSSIREQKEALRALGPHKRGLEILADYLDNENELLEIQRMTPYIHSAEHQDSIMLPAEEKYASVLYMFLDRVLGRSNKYSGEPIDEATIELIAKELMTNAVKHGYSHQPGGMVEVGYVADQARIEISFTDHGRGYAPADRGEDRLPSAGLLLLRKIFDELTIGEAPRGKAEGLVLGPGTTVRMVKYLKANAGA